MKPNDSSEWLRNVCADFPVMPVLTVKDPDVAAPLAEALAAGGIRVIEVTLRTPNATDAIRSMAARPDCLAGAGTLLTPADAAEAKEAGAAFGVSPGSTPELIKTCVNIGLPLLPGAVTPTEIMRLVDQGFDFLKFFPAGPSGGPAALNAIAGPFPQVKFCPTGGVSPENAGSYLSLANVVCVGGSWIAPPSAIEREDWASIRRAARKAVSCLAKQ